MSMLDAFQMIQNGTATVKVLFISHLSDLFRKSLGPNTLNHWEKEEKECMEIVNHYFARMDIPYEPKVITVPPWEMVFDEIRVGVQDLIILQNELLEKWKKGKANRALCSDAISRSRCPILVINSSEDTRDSAL
jgi:hypothetical protein